MPTVIDSLLVTLGLDVKEYDKGTKDATDSTKKLKQASEKDLKAIEENGKKLAEGEAVRICLRRVDGQLARSTSSRMSRQACTIRSSSAGVSEQLIEKRIKERFFGVAGAQNTEPKMPRASSASRRTMVCGSGPASKAMICDWLPCRL